MADILPEQWMKGVAVTTTILAVCASIAGSRGTACVAKNQVLTSMEGSQWAYYQAKSIKQNMAETQRKAFEVDKLGSQNADQLALLEKELETYRSEIERYNKEKNDIKKQAEDLGKQNGVVNRRGNQFSLSVVFLQIGIMLSSVSALIKRKELWLFGLIFGVVGFVFLANGLFLLF